MKNHHYVFLFVWLWASFLGISNANAARKPAKPYTYADLQQEIAPALRRHDFGEALAIAQSHQTQLGDLSDYQHLLLTLAGDFDSTLVAVPFPAAINSDGDEYGPVLSGDGQTLMFCGQYRSNNFGAEDIFVSRRIDGQWTKAKLVSDLATGLNEAPMSLTIDGTGLLLFQQGRMFASEIVNGYWSRPSALPDYLTISPYQVDGFLSADGRAFFFAAETRTEREEKSSLNIYVSLLDDNGHWSHPVELGPSINTSGLERSPVLHADGKTLYFSSSSHGSLGALDVYMSTRLDDTYTNWSEPKNLGLNINTPDNECWYRFSADGQMAYFAAADSRRIHDLYWIQLPEEVRPEPVIGIAEQVVRMEHIYFATAKADLLPESCDELNRWVEWLVLHPEAVIEISGHTDNVGSETDNMILSRNRAESVKAYLVQHGCIETNILTTGYGESRPIADNHTDQGRAINRRVEVRFVK
ncbi:MAG: OmpA family protein [Paludibacteraceae bacterium]|nr:OmpA family protein [Paludibacteraceae bacterium]